MIRRIFSTVVLACAFAAASCGGGSTNPAAPSSTTSTTTSTVTTFTLAGTVTSAAGGGIAGATVSVSDGAPNPNAGKSAVTDGNGNYSISGLQLAGMTINASAPGYVTLGKSPSVSTGTSSTTLNYSLLPSAIFTKSGAGNNVFDLPVYVKRIHITGTYTGNSSNFIVHIATVHVVNDLVGTFWGTTVSDGTYVIAGGGTVEVLESTGVAWTFTEVR